MTLRMPSGLASRLRLTALAALVGVVAWTAMGGFDRHAPRPADADGTHRQRHTGDDGIGGGRRSTVEVSAGLHAADAGAASIAHAIRRARAEPAYRKALLARYRHGRDGDERHLLSVVLAAVAEADVRDTALAMAAGRDPARRVDGLDLLQSFSLEDAAVRRYVAAALAQERDPALRLELLQMLAPSGVPDDERPALERHLLAAADDPDPRLRAAALRRIGLWRSGPELEPTLLRALTDSDISVRLAAIETATHGRSGSDALGTTLLAIAGDPDRSDLERSTARNAFDALPSSAAVPPAERARLIGTIGTPED